MFREIFCDVTSGYTEINFVKFSVENSNVHKVEQKCWETILMVRETILRVNIFSKFNFLKCSYF